MKVFMLDVTGCKRSVLDGYSELILCRLGQGKYDLDVIEDRVPKSVVKQWKSKSMKAHSDILHIWDPSKPLGFNLDMIPAGAVITVMEERADV